MNITLFHFNALVETRLAQIKKTNLIKEDKVDDCSEEITEHCCLTGTDKLINNEKCEKCS